MSKSAPPGWPPGCHCCKSAGSNSSHARRAILFCPPIPVSSSKTPTGAGRNAIWPATPLTSASRCSACPSTTPCARSPAHKTTADVAGLRRQSGQNPGQKSKNLFYDASVENHRKTISYDASAVKNLEAHQKYKNVHSCHNLTIRAWLFGCKLRRQRGRTPKNLTTPNRPFLRRQLSS